MANKRTALAFMLLVLVRSLCIYPETYIGDSSHSYSDSDEKKKENNTNNTENDTNSEGEGEDDDDDNGPNPADEALAKAQGELTKAEENYEKLESKSASQGSLKSAETRLASAKENVEKAKQAAKEAAKLGDPVLATTGRYILEEADYAPMNGDFRFVRSYMTENNMSGSLGKYWYASIDTRIVRGATPLDRTVLVSMQNETTALYTEWRVTDSLADTYSNCQSIADTILQLYAAANRKTDEMKAACDRSDLLHGLNAYSLFQDSPSYYEGVGNESLVLVDEDGSPGTFEYESNGKWLPSDKKIALHTRLESLDGKGAESTAGFVLFTKNGIKKYFSGFGLLTAIVDRNGNRTEIIRNAATGKVTRVETGYGSYEFVYASGLINKITGPEGKTVDYGYTGGVLTGVTDTDGDTVKYEYTDGRLAKIIKSDNSFILLDYGYARADGTKLTTSTTNEEGASEKFEYYPYQKLTVYTNHSGVATGYWYDDSHRTVREEHADGTVKTFRYNAVTGNLDAETVNGDTTTYTCDERGNRDSVRYSDGSSETWKWNDLDETTQYRDRDGVETTWAYDAKGNCTTIFRDGIQLFAGTYDGTGLLVTAKTGERDTEYYTYDAHGNLAGRTTGPEAVPSPKPGPATRSGGLLLMLTGQAEKRHTGIPGKT